MKIAIITHDRAIFDEHIKKHNIPAKTVKLVRVWRDVEGQDFSDMIEIEGSENVTTTVKNMLRRKLNLEIEE